MGEVLTLGEIMLRFSTEQSKRIMQSQKFYAHYGGSEANVAISLANYGHCVRFASKVPNHVLGTAVQQHLQQYNVNTNHLLFGGERLGSYYVESGVGPRAASVIYDRTGSSFATMSELEWDLDDLFNGVELFHVSGITPALSDFWQKQTILLVKAAKEYGCKVSFDINYRGKLWSQQKAGEVIRQILPYADYCAAGHLDAIYLLDVEEKLNDSLPYYYQKLQEIYPNIELFYSTKREVVSASENQLTGTLWMNQAYYESSQQIIAPIIDRVGGGDAFAGGVLHGLLTDKNPQELIDFATAAAVLKHTVEGDCNQFNEVEVASFLAAGSGKIIR